VAASCSAGRRVEPSPRPWLAAVLSLFLSPFGFLYVGRLKRAVVFLIFRMLSSVAGIYPAE
jgi:hypothetical protein